ncbi:PCP reductase family protein [Myxosarcina sp. GI1(2024)]
MNNFNLMDDLHWTPEAKEKLRKIPFFVRPQARQRIEELARTAESEEVTSTIVERARLEFGQ